MSEPPLLHHVGVVVAELDQAVTFYGHLGFRKAGSVVVDRERKVRIQFLIDGKGQRIELLEPHGSGSPVQRALEKGGGVNHLCFLVDDLDQAVAQMRSFGAVRISDPSPAPALSGARVAFFYDGKGGVFELVESPAEIPAAGDIEDAHR